MDLDKYTTEDLILTALRAELDARAVYETLAGGVRNAYLKGRLEFLASEEEKHERYLDGLYRTEFPEREPQVPATTPVPLPEVRIPTEQVPISEVLSQAMAAEKAAADFYGSMATRWAEATEQREVLLYFSKMETGHYRLLETEMQAAAEFEDFDQFWPLMHAGP